jgi:hypothetical protein
MSTQENESPVITAVTLAADMRDFRIETTTASGRAYAMLTCKPCSGYVYRISSAAAAGPVTCFVPRTWPR